MKRVLLICAVLCLAFAVASPAMAVEAKFSGQYFVKGFHNTNYALDDDDASDSYMTMRLRIQSDFYISDNLNLTTRFDALDHKRWGSSDGPEGVGDDNIDFDRAYMTVKGDFGLFNFGRMSGGAWGTLFNDTETERDRIKYVKSIGDLTVIAIYEKISEGDEGNEVSDQDYDIYYIAPYYKMENITFGLLVGYSHNKSNPTRDDTFFNCVPYAIGQFGPFGFQGELRYNGFGERDFDDPNLDDQDFEQMAWNLEGTFAMDMFKFELGWVHVDAQEGEDDIVGYGGAIGDDWEKVWILTGSTDDNTAANLGGQGNLSTTGSSAGGPLAAFGAEIFYGGVTVTPMEGLDVGLLIAYAEAEDTPSGLDDEYGWEYDLRVNYKIYDNLTYSFIAAYLDAGDYWEESGGVDDGDLEDNLHLYQALTLKF